MIDVTAPKDKKAGCNCNVCQQVWNWSVQIILWGFIIYIGVAGGINHYLQIWEIIILCVIYCIYLINFFCYKSCCFLNNRHEKATIYNYMQKMYYTPAFVNFHVECFHYETRHYTTSNSKGHVTHHTRTEKVVTHREAEKFRYFSWRDTSGILMMDSKNAKHNNKAYVKLELELKFELADDISIYDYNLQKTSQYARNKFRDTHINQWESTTLENFNTYNLVNISEKEPPCINIWWYVFFTFVPIIMLYDLYFNYWCLNQDYTLKKTVSTRFNLLSPENDGRFIGSIPRIIFNEEEILYNEAPQPLCDAPELPNENDLMNAAEFVRQQTLNPNFGIADSSQQNNNNNLNNDEINNNQPANNPGNEIHFNNYNSNNNYLPVVNNIIADDYSNNLRVNAQPEEREINISGTNLSKGNEIPIDVNLQNNNIHDNVAIPSAAEINIDVNDIA